MKKFILQIFIFCLIPFLILTLSFFLLNTYIRNGNYFKLDNSIKNIIIGHSLPQHAFNDSLISNTRNLCKDGTNYFYFYYRIKKVLECNPQIENVFIDISNNIFYKDYNKNIYLYSHLPFKYPNTAILISLKDNLYLAIKNITGYIIAVYKSLLLNTVFVSLNGEKNYIEWSDWGNYYYSSDTLDFDKYLVSFQPNPIYGDTTVSEFSTELLLRTINVCKEHNVNVYLIRTPVHPKNEMLKNENQFKYLVINKFGELQFLDFKEFPLNNNEFRNIAHLNYKGAIKFSSFFNELLTNGLLNKQDKQLFINDEIKRVVPTK